MRLTSLSLGALTLLLLIAVPVNAAPALHKGSQTSYNLSVSISVFQSCEPILTSTLSAGMVRPMIAMISPSLNINGTLGCIVTDLTATTATLNVTRDITTSSGETITPATHHTWNFNESIDLATRIATILPFIEPEIDQALRMAQTNIGVTMPTGTSWGSTMSGLDVTMMRQSLQTMWWVNGPLKVNDTVPVLVLPTNVTGSTSLDLGGSIGTRSAWTLAFPRTGSPLPPDPMTTMASTGPITNNFGFALTFNYDQTSDLLLSASADIHLGFSEETFIPPAPCSSSATTAPALTVCPATPIPLMRQFGIDVQVSLKLTSTTLDLSQRLTPTSGSESSTESSFGSGSGTGTGNGQGPGTSPGRGSNFGSNSGSGSGYNPGTSGTTTGAGQSSDNLAQSKSTTKSVSLVPWMYGILGIIAAAIIGSAVLIARRRIKEPPSKSRSHTRQFRGLNYFRDSKEHLLRLKSALNRPNHTNPVSDGMLMGEFPDI